MTNNSSVETNHSLRGDQAEALLRALSTWGNTTTIVLQGGCVFEFKGVFPMGTIAQGFYNLNGSNPGFHGHIRLQSIACISFQDKPHRGRESYAFVFRDSNDEIIFKVFLGRQRDGQLIAHQVVEFKRIQSTLVV
jgi:putative heme utilization carrier protein HutX